MGILSDGIKVGDEEVLRFRKLLQKRKNITVEPERANFDWRIFILLCDKILISIRLD